MVPQKSEFHTKLFKNNLPESNTKLTWKLFFIDRREKSSILVSCFSQLILTAIQKTGRFPYICEAKIAGDFDNEHCNVVFIHLAWHPQLLLMI